MSDFDYLKRKIEQQNRIYQEMLDIQSRPEKENRDWTADERERWDKAEADLREVSADIDRLERARELDSVDFRQVVRAGSAMETPESTPEERARKQDEDYEQAFWGYTRNQQINAEQRTLLMRNAASLETRGTTPQITTSGAAGGYLVPPGFRQELIQALKAYGGLYNLANVIVTSTGNPLQWPTVDDTGNVGYILTPENTAVTVNNVTFGTSTLGAWTYTSGSVVVSWQLLQDSVFPLQPFLAEAFGQRIGRASAAHFIAGTGSSQPVGLAPNTTVAVTGAAGFGITYDNLIDLEHSVDPAYRALGNTRFLMSDTMLALILKLKDSQGRPLYNPVPVPGEPPTINGRPFTIDQSMAVPGANAVPLLYGDFKRGYNVRQVLDIQMVALHERIANQLASEFFAYSRLDAAPGDPKAVKAFKNGAT